MTPELITACEVVFQEHKSSSQIKWNRDAFRGRISIGLSEMAKETLVKKNIIFRPNKSKRIITLLNPAVAAAASFAEAEEMIKNKALPLAKSTPVDQPNSAGQQVSGFDIPPGKYSRQLFPITDKSPTQVAEIKWYMKPLFYYIVWPFCAAVAGALISFLIDLAYTGLFLDWK